MSYKFLRLESNHSNQLQRKLVIEQWRYSLCFYPPPVRTILQTTDVDDGFGLNDYAGDNNFPSTPLPLVNTSVIRVGKKFNQLGGGELSPVRRANVATFIFTPTATNYKVRVHYIGVLQESNNTPDYYRVSNGALRNFRRENTSTSRNAATFGLVCRYEYQSFFVNTTSTGVATFKNNMRVGSQNQENSQFYRNANIPAGESSPCVSEDRHRLWLQIRNTTPIGINPIQFKQTLVGYADNATTSTSLDRDYDSGLLNTSHPTTVNIYSLNPANDPLMIQGRGLATPFDTTDVIPLGFSCKYLISSEPGLNENTIQIAASEFDGLFLTTDFWLRINQGGGVYSYHDIKTTPYTFEIGVGGDVLEDTTTFAIVFSNPLPRNAQTKKEAFKVVASPNTFENSITFEVITAEQSPINVQIFDLLGKLVEQGDFSVEGIKDHLFGTQLSTGVYQAIITQGNQRDVQKIIKK